MVNSEGTIAGLMDTVVETTETVLAQQRAEVLNAELSHRIRNILSLVGSIASQTIRSGGDVDEIERSLSRRLQALANVQDLLRTGHTIEAYESVSDGLPPSQDANTGS